MQWELYAKRLHLAVNSLSPIIPLLLFFAKKPFCRLGNVRHYARWPTTVSQRKIYCLSSTQMLLTLKLLYFSSQQTWNPSFVVKALVVRAPAWIFFCSCYSSFCQSHEKFQRKICGLACHAHNLVEEVTCPVWTPDFYYNGKRLKSKLFQATSDAFHRIGNIELKWLALYLVDSLLASLKATKCHHKSRGVKIYCLMMR